MSRRTFPTEQGLGVRALCLSIDHGVCRRTWLVLLGSSLGSLGQKLLLRSARTLRSLPNPLAEPRQVLIERVMQQLLLEPPGRIGWPLSVLIELVHHMRHALGSCALGQELRDFPRDSPLCQPLSDI